MLTHNSMSLCIKNQRLASSLILRSLSITTTTAVNNSNINDDDSVNLAKEFDWKIIKNKFDGACYGLSVKPKISPTSFVAKGAVVMGDVEMGEHSSVFYNCTVR